jgi:hypothetical protein
VAIERVTVHFEDGPVTILPKRAPVGNSGPIRGHSLAVFPTVDRSALPQGVAAFPATIEPGAVPAQALLDVTEAEATTVGAALGLSEILFWDGRRAQILVCG